MFIARCDGIDQRTLNVFVTVVISHMNSMFSPIAIAMYLDQAFPLIEFDELRFNFLFHNLEKHDFKDLYRVLIIGFHALTEKINLFYGNVTGRSEFEMIEFMNSTLDFGVNPVPAAS